MNARTQNCVSNNGLTSKSKNVEHY